MFNYALCTPAKAYTRTQTQHMHKMKGIQLKIYNILYACQTEIQGSTTRRRKNQTKLNKTNKMTKEKERQHKEPETNTEGKLHAVTISRV